jgi:hypothetical protein
MSYSSSEQGTEVFFETSGGRTIALLEGVEAVALSSDDFGFV